MSKSPEDQIETGIANEYEWATAHNHPGQGFLRGMFIRHRAPAAPIAPKRGRNDPCWCGSGKKYKRCHYDADRTAD